MPATSIEQIWIDKIGLAPGTSYPGDAQVDHLRSWLITKGIPSREVDRMKDYHMRKAYESLRYLNGIKRRIENQARPGTSSTYMPPSAYDDEMRNAERDDVTANALASVFDDDVDSVVEATADVGPANEASGQRTPDSVVSATTEQIAKAADFVLNKKLTEFQAKISTEIATKVANTKLELSEAAKQQIRDLAASTAKAVIESLAPPRRIEIHDTTTDSVRDLGIQHEKFPVLLRACQARLPNGFRPNIWLTGPAGAGKTTAVENVAKALGNDFASDGSLDADYKVLGFRNATGEFCSTEFLRVFESGGVYCADEIDNWLPSALLSLNSALANGWISTAKGLIRRHPNFICIACANTWGMGATNEYVGRTKLDAASLDRFQPKIDWPIDERLEMSIALELGGSDWCQTVQSARKAAKTQGLQIIISPRATYAGIALLAQGFERQEVIEMTFASGLKPEQVKALNIAQAPAPTKRDVDISLSLFRDAIANQRMLEAVRLLREGVAERGGRLELRDAIDLAEQFRDGLIDRETVGWKALQLGQVPVRVGA